VGDFSNPPPHPSQLDALALRAKPSSFDPARSRAHETRTTATRRVFTNPDGSTTMEVASGPVRFQDSTGWRDIDLSLVTRPDGTLGAKSATKSASLGAKGDTSVATIDTSAGSISLRHPGARPVPAVVDRERATYPGGLGGSDLALALNTSGFSEMVTVNSEASGPVTE
jgi:hypothetical protein